MALHAISVFDMVFNEALKIVNYKNIISFPKQQCGLGE